MREATPRPRRVRWAALTTAVVLAVVAIVVVAQRDHRGTGAEHGPVATTEEFLDSLGVAVRLQFHSDRYPLLRAALGDLGVRHIRVGGQGATFRGQVLDLHGSFGIRSTLVMDPRDGYTGMNAVAQGVLPVLPAVEAVEGPNEWDLNPDLTYAGRRFPEGVRDFQAEMYRSVKGYTSTDAAEQGAVRSLDVLSPTVADPEQSRVLGRVACDVGAMHSYPGGNGLPDNKLLDEWKPSADRLCGTGRVVSTESGYCNDIRPEGCTNQGGVSERASAKLALRHYFEYFNAGVQRDFLYNLSTDEWDLFLSADGRRKPAFQAVRTLVELLESPGAAEPVPRPRVAVRGPDSLRSRLLRTTTGNYYLALWLNVRSYDAGRTCCDAESAERVQVRLGENYDAEIFLPTFEGLAPVETRHATGVLEVNVPDQVMLVRLSAAT